MEIVSITARPRAVGGKEAAKRLRREGLVPAVMYQSGGGNPIHFAVHPSALRPLVYTSKFKLGEIDLEGAKYRCIVKDIQFHPVTDQIIHIDFLRLMPGIPFKATVPLRFEGQAPGIKAGGKFIATMRKVNILTTPEHVVDEVVADISKMELGTTIRVRDIPLPEGVSILNNGAIPIALIEVPRALRSGK
ncbi:MAG: 50S ribosomal protein L25 [Saprospiraceae bacterium]|nr:50S ribosomal protein L25 [Saprospiraceae bacterium]MDW8483637.1 50S ribosomal protein L25 [Saprospiraceae bacterium]